MLNYKCIDYKYSIFGDFSFIQSSIKELSKTLGEGYAHSIIGNEVVGSNVFPVFSFKGSNNSIVVGRTRVDFVAFSESQGIDMFKELFNLTRKYLPDNLDRFAINVSYRIMDFNLEMKKRLASSTFLSSIGNQISEFAIRQNFPTNIGSFKGNNIITIQTGFFFDNNDFTTKQVLSASIDVNTIPFIKTGKDDDINRISLDEINRLIDPITEIATIDQKRIFELLK